ncbi:MAG: cytochrome c maturation protein CcmE [bacterium]
MKRQIQFAVGGAIILAILGAILYQGFQSTVFFYTPGEILADREEFQGRIIRIGALVQGGTTRWDPNAVRLSFDITDETRKVIPVVFDGVKPDMYREGKGVVVEGRLDRGGVFRATAVLVKHSEEYAVDQTKRQDKERLYQSLLKK